MENSYQPFVENLVLNLGHQNTSTSDFLKCHSFKGFHLNFRRNEWQNIATQFINRYHYSKTVLKKTSDNMLTNFQTVLLELVLDLFQRSFHLLNHICCQLEPSEPKDERI